MRVGGQVNGSLAIWYEPVGTDAEGGSEQPRLELHFNLWRDLPSRTNFLDVGLLISRPQSLGRAYLFFPAPLELAQIADLSTVLKFGRTLSAVFNSVVELGPQADEYYETLTGGRPHVTVHHLVVGRDITVEPVQLDARGSGAILALTEAACTRLRSAPGDRQYVRFRIKLRGRSRSLFSNDVTTPDRVFVSSFHRLEITEFRLNEQRSYPPAFARLAREHMFHIERVHYFLIRELSHELVMGHQPYRKVRRLEAKLWAHYLQGEASDDLPVVSERVASKMVIYHWKEEQKRVEENLRPIEDFVAFASFKSSTSSILIYIFAIILLGALGSALWTSVGSYTWRAAASLAGMLVVLMIVTSPLSRDLTARLRRLLSEAWRNTARHFRD